MKTNIIKGVIGILFLIAFNVLFFVLGGTEQSTSNWISYGFIHASYLCLLATPLLCTSAKGLTVNAASLWLRAISYFFIELVVGLIFIAVNPKEILWTLIVQTVMLLVFLVLQLMSVLANDATEASINKQRAESNVMRGMADKISCRIGTISNYELRRKVEIAYNSIKNSPIESYPEVVNQELSLATAVDVLCAAIDSNNEEQVAEAVKRVQIAARERNSAITRARMS